MRNPKVTKNITERHLRLMVANSLPTMIIDAKTPHLEGAGARLPAIAVSRGSKRKRKKANTMLIKCIPLIV
jgi:hypothetical protein